jgi:hypothetical protein
MTEDRKRELDAMRIMDEQLSALDEDARARVLAWVGALYPVGTARVSGREGEGEQEECPDFAALYNAARASTEADKALVAGYWLQVREGSQDLEGYRINAILRDLGYKVSNITDALSTLMARKPALVIQTRKGGSSKQARKRYRLTGEGIRAVEKMIAESGTGEAG